MKKKVIYLGLCLMLILSCRKDQVANHHTLSTDHLTLGEVKHWFAQDSAQQLKTTGVAAGFNLYQLHFDWNKASNIAGSRGNWWIMALPGQPVFQGAKQGYRKLAFYRDSTQALQARIMEIIPDAAYLQQHRQVSSTTFTGHVFFYDQDYHLTGGRIFNRGQQVGSIKPPSQSSNIKLQSITQNCDWVDDNYIDAEGVVTIYTYQVCTTVDDELLTRSGEAASGSGDPLGDGGGSGGDGSSAPPAAALPGQTNAAVDPKAYVKCFGSLPDAGAKETITVYVQEPQPGLPFNVGTNSVGHTAISLTKTSNGQTVTQTLGFYPTDHKLAATGTPGKIVDNGDLGYTVSITYNVLPYEFNAIANFIANPAATYNLYTYNCTNFVSDACNAGDITLPDPTGNVGMFQTGMLPGALGASIRNAAPVANVDTKGGFVGVSHGPCN